MNANIDQRLENDHDDLDKLLKQLLAAMEANDVERSYLRLDLFWARLAMHIRAEHLHLFPAIQQALEVDNTKAIADAPSLADAQSTLEQLRRDHDFFMKELARAIATMRDLLKTADSSDSVSIGVQLQDVRATLAAVQERLSAHNLVEEHKVYLWPSRLLNEVEQSALRDRLEMELANLPPRFKDTRYSI